MTRIILNGASGKMGRKVAELCLNDSDAVIVAGIDKAGGSSDMFPVFTDISKCNVDGDVLVDFSRPDAVYDVMSYAMTKRMPVVLCTTGYTDGQLELIEKASENIPVLISSNMSIGVNVVKQILESVVSTLVGAGFDIEIVEKHHNQKVDSPSGTAITLANAMNKAMNGMYGYVYDRSMKHERRGKNEIGISSVRGGSIVGDHDVIFAGEDEVITISHRAYSRAVFAKGAIQAAKFMASDSCHHFGLYTMKEALARKGE